jgi:general secretion pathway protein D
MKVGSAEEKSDLESYATYVIPVQYTEAEDLKNLLTPLLPKTDSITSYGPTNLLIVTTTESLLSRLNRIIAMVDVPGSGEEVRIIEVRYASVEDLAAKISQVLQTQAGTIAAKRPSRGQAAPPAVVQEGKIIADERTNSLIAIGDLQTLDSIEDLVRKLDISVAQGTGKVHVYYLQNADAGELAAVLTGIPLEESVANPETPPGQPAPKTTPSIRA